MKQLQITAPEGFEIDQDKSDLSKGIVFFKEIKKNLSYEDVSTKLLGDSFFYMSSNGNIDEIKDSCYFLDKNNSTTKEQLSSILSLNQLCNVAKYLNGDWLPDFNGNNHNYFLFFDSQTKKINISYNLNVLEGNVFFKTKELTLQAIEILGKETIRKALTLNY